jgi:hypothetical protein
MPAEASHGGPFFTAALAAVLILGGQFLLPVLQRSQHGTLVRRSPGAA